MFHIIKQIIEKQGRNKVVNKNVLDIRDLTIDYFTSLTSFAWMIASHYFHYDKEISMIPTVKEQETEYRSSNLNPKKLLLKVILCISKLFKTTTISNGKHNRSTVSEPN